MRVILFDDVVHVRKMGEVVKVSDGFARNYLIPQGFAVLATEQKARAIAHQKAMVEHKKAKILKAMQGVAGQLEGVSLSMSRAASKEGKLHGSVTNRDIAEALAAKGIEVDKRKIQIEPPIREIGEREIEIRLAADVVAKIKVNVAAIVASEKI